MRGEKTSPLKLFRLGMIYKSKYISEKFPIPTGWTAEEFWWAIEQLEKYGNENNLFDLAHKLGIIYDEIYRGKVDAGDLVIVIVTEGRTKNEIMDAIKQFAEEQTKK